MPNNTRPVHMKNGENYSGYSFMNTNAVAWSEMNELGAKNLIPYPYIDTTKTEKGLTFTDNGDGTVTVNGTATANAYFSLTRYDATDFLLPKGSYIGSGCPSGGSNSTYQIRFIEPNASRVEDNGESVEINYNEDTYCGVYIYVYKNAVINNLTFKPMIRFASINDDTYVPYAKTNRELTEDESKGYRLVGSDNISVTADGVKTITELLTSLASSLQTTVINTLANDEAIALDAINLNSCITGVGGKNRNALVLLNKSSTFTGAMFNGGYSGSALNSIIFSVTRFGGSGQGAVSYTSGNASVTNHSSTVPASGKTIVLYYNIYKKI